MQTEPDTGRPAPGLDDRDATSPDGNSRHPVAHLAAGCLAGAAIIHFAMVPQHAGDSLLDPIGFAVAGWAQLWLAAALLRRDARDSTHGIAIVVNLALIGVWLWSRTSGLPWGAHAGVAEEIGAVDLIAVALQTVAVLASIAVLGTSAPVRRSSALTPLIGGVAALGLATAAIVSPDAASHGHTGETAVAAGGHAHGANGTDANHAGEMQLVDDTRCDQGFNPAAYWNEARTLGVDIYGGGAMAAQTTDESVMSAVAAPDPLGGRGSAGLDELIGATDGAGTSEIAAAGLVVRLSQASDTDYGAWLSWLRSSHATSGHSHGATATTAAASGDDNAGHGGHVGPQPWKAMVDTSQCEALAEELRVARDTALKYPTVKDAEAAGWRMVTPYVPGIAAHYMNFGLVDGTFEADKPEMILYDGTEPDSRVVGLSYYILKQGASEPTQGFTGGNDHYHRHVGLCMRDGVTIGDSSTTEAECVALGGSKGKRNDGWMSHAWVVPGCESPWGVFSAASPILDRDVNLASGSKGEPCAASRAARRYDLSPGTVDDVAVGPALAAGTR